MEKTKKSSLENAYEQLLENVERNTKEIKYGTNCSALGYFCPSLVMDKITAGFSKGRLLKTMPILKNGNKIVYDIDNEGKLLRMQDINSFGTNAETFIIRERETEFSVIFLNKEITEYYTASHRAIYKNAKLIQFDTIGNTDLWSEIYEYNPKNERKVECKQYYYVPNLNGSDKTIPVGEKGSPAQLFIMDIELNEQGKVIKLEHSEFLNGKKRLTYKYEK